MALPLWAMLAMGGAGLGLIKGKEDQSQAWAKRMTDLAQARTSGFTGQQAQFTAMPGLIGPMATGAYQGAMMGKDFTGDMKPETQAKPVEAEKTAGSLKEAGIQEYEPGWGGQLPAEQDQGLSVASNGPFKAKPSIYGILARKGMVG